MTKDNIETAYLKNVYEYADKNIFLFFFSASNAFIEYLGERNRKESTLDNTRTHLNAICDYVFMIVGKKTFAEVDEKDIYRIIGAMTGLHPHTKRTYIETFGRLLKFSTGVNIVTEMDILWSDCDTRRIFIQTEDWPRIKKKIESPTERLAIYLGAFMGLRASEMCRIQLTDIQGDSLIIHGKGHGKDGKIAIMQIPEPVTEAIIEYMNYRSKLHLESSQLLVQTEVPWRGRPMNRSSINKICNNISDRSGVKFTPHSLRRLFATTMYEITGHDIETTMKLTRHEDSATLLKCYVEPSNSKKRTAMDRISTVL